MSKTAVTGSLLSFDIDRASHKPLYHQLAEHLRNAITAGRLPAGTKLPSTRVVADELDVSRITVVQAFDALQTEGLLVSKVGAGTFVTDEGGRMDKVARAPTETVAPKSGRNDIYPFRSLSHRGSRLVSSVRAEFAERPRSFMPDIPDLREFPIKTWLRLLGETSGRLTGEILVDTSNAGYEPLRKALAQHLSASRGMQCDWQQIIITTGSQQSLHLVCQMLSDPGDAVWFEEPGYIGTRSVIRGSAGSICPVPVDAQGLCVDAAIATHPVPRLIFVTPARQYPTGATLSQPRRELLMQFAHASGAWIVEDDYDNEFRYVGHTPQAIHGMDKGGRTIHIGTFSKILLPSFRLGYIVVPPDLSEAFGQGRAVVDRHASLIEQMVLSEFMNRGLLVSHIRRMRNLYRARQTQLIAGLRDMLGADLAFTGTETGLHVTLQLTGEADDVALTRQAAQSDVVVRPLSPYFATRQRRQGLLLGFAAFNHREIDDGLERLSSIEDKLKRYLLPADLAIF